MLSLGSSTTAGTHLWCELGQVALLQKAVFSPLEIWILVASELFVYP